MAKILLVDDDPVLLKLYSTKLKADKHDVKTCNNGADALKLLESFAPDLIVLDLMMPKMNGFMFIDSIKANKALRNIPVLVFSSLANPESVDLKNKGVTKILNKIETSPTQLVAIIDKILGRAKEK